MTLMEQIAVDLKDAMKAQDKFALSVYRMLKSALQLEAIEKKEDLSDDAVIAVVKRQIKMRKDSIQEYLKYGKEESIADLEHEIALLEKYLPVQLSEDEIQTVVEEVFQELKPQSMKDMGGVMKSLTEKIGNQADMSMVSSIVKERLLHL